MIDLRLGDWRETMADVECDALITDSPFSPRTEDGFRTMAGIDTVRGVGYEPITEAYCRAFVQSWSPRVGSWWVLFGDHISCRWWLDALDGADLQTFAPVVWVKACAPPRLCGDGPASQCEYIAVARRRGLWATSPPWGSLPGHYTDRIVTAARGDEYYGVTGGKPESLMKAIVRDYTKPGDVIADPHAGSGTTLVAARAEGRSCIGSEMDPATYEIARKRLAQPFARDLFQREAV